MTALQHNAVRVEVKILGRPGRVDGHTEHRYEQDGDGHKENGTLRPMFFGPPVIGRRQFGCKFKNADDLEGAHSDAGQAHSEAEDEKRLLEDAGQRRRLAKVAQRAHGSGSQGCQHQEAGAASGRLGHGCVEVEQEDYGRAGGHEKTAGQKEEQGDGKGVVPGEQQDGPVQTLLTALGSPLLWQTLLASSGI